MTVASASASTTTTTSSGTVTGTGSVNLSSPESAYSTGYSTDGTSPGTSFPPEYYINIRTGTHYFQSNGNNGRPKRPTDSPATLTDLSTAATLLSGHGNHDSTASLANMTRDNELPRDIRSNTPNKARTTIILSLSLLCARNFLALFSLKFCSTAVGMYRVVVDNRWLCQSNRSASG